MFLLIPAMIIVGLSGICLGRKRKGIVLSNKKKKIPIIAITGIFILLSSAFYLEMKASNDIFDSDFIPFNFELSAGFSDLILLFLSIIDGLKMTERIKS